MLRGVVDNCIKEMSSIGVCIHTVYMKVCEDVLWDRICERLEREPERRRYNEHNKEWLQRTLRWYEKNKWDHTINNNDECIEDVLAQLETVRGRITAENHT